MAAVMKRMRRARSRWYEKRSHISVKKRVASPLGCPKNVFPLIACAPGAAYSGVVLKTAPVSVADIFGLNASMEASGFCAFFYGASPPWNALYLGVGPVPGKGRIQRPRFSLTRTANIPYS